MVLKTDEFEGKILKICIKIKKFSEKFRNNGQSLETFFGNNNFKNQKISEKFRNIVKVWKHIFGKNYFEHQKNQVSKFDSNVLNF